LPRSAGRPPFSVRSLPLKPSRNPGRFLPRFWSVQFCFWRCPGRQSGLALFGLPSLQPFSCLMTSLNLAAQSTFALPPLVISATFLGTPFEDPQLRKRVRGYAHSIATRCTGYPICSHPVSPPFPQAPPPIRVLSPAHVGKISGVGVVLRRTQVPPYPPPWLEPLTSRRLTPRDHYAAFFFYFRPCPLLPRPSLNPFPKAKAIFLHQEGFVYLCHFF